MPNSEVLTLVTGVTAIILSLWALIKAHSTPAVAVDGVIQGVLNNSTITSAIEGYGKSISPDVLKMILDAGSLTTTLATGALNLATASAQTPPSAAGAVGTSSAADTTSPVNTSSAGSTPSATPNLPTTLATNMTPSATS